MKRWIKLAHFSAPQVTFSLLLIIASCYYAIFLYTTSFIVDGERFFTLFDDAMISMRYAKNLSQGYGLVWNPGGERVEGYTNFLWVIIMTGVHFFPLPPSKISLPIQIMGALTLLVNLVILRMIINRYFYISEFISFIILFSTAFYLPLINWSLQGMEVSLLALIILIGLLNGLKYLDQGTSLHWVYIALGVGFLVRPDILILLISFLLFFFIFDSTNWRKHFSYFILVIAIFVIPLTLFRYVYFGDFLPNTYYVKMTGYPFFYRITKGIIASLEQLFYMNLVAFLTLLSIIFIKFNKKYYLIMWLFISQVLYHIYVGGDAWNCWGSRYICIVMPLFFLLFWNGIDYFLSEMSTNYKFHWISVDNFKRAVLVIVLFFTFININCINNSPEYFLMIKSPLHVLDNEILVKQALLSKEITKKSATIAVAWAGIIPYFVDRQCIDFLGKCDRTIAHSKMKTVDGINKLWFFYPGHLKFDYNYSIGALKPDLILQLWNPFSSMPMRDIPDDFMNNLLKEYVQYNYENKTVWFLRRGSPNIYWKHAFLDLSKSHSGV